MKNRTVILPALVAVAVTLPLAASAGASQSASPPTGARLSSWSARSCYADAGSIFRGRGVFRSTIHKVPTSTRRYYQRIDLQVEQYSSRAWRRIGGSSTKSSSFRRSNLSTAKSASTTVRISSTVAASRSLSVKARVRLYEDRPYPKSDLVVWEYSTRSPKFTCYVSF